MAGLIGILARCELLYVVARCVLNAAFATPGLRTWLIRRHATKLGRTDAEYSLGVLAWHLPHLAPDGRVEGKVFAELGPGTNVGTMVALLLLGARKVYAFDVFAYDQWREQPGRVVRAVNAAIERTGSLPRPGSATLAARARRLEQSGLAELTYVAPYHGFLAPVADNELDGVYSHTVLQYVHDLVDLHREVRRCLRPGGVSSHHIDLTAQGLGLGAELQHLRYPEWLWWLMSSRHPGAENRLRKSDHVAAMEAAGLGARVVKETAIPELPCPPDRFARQFREHTDADLRSVAVHVVAVRPR